MQVGYVWVPAFLNTQWEARTLFERVTKAIHYTRNLHVINRRGCLSIEPPTQIRLICFSETLATESLYQG